MNKTTAWGDAVAWGCGKYWKSRCVSEEKRRLEGRLRKDIHSWSRESGMEWRNLDTLGEERWWTSSRQKSSEQGWPRCYILTENSPSNFTIEAETRNGKAVFLTCGGGREERALGRTELRDISEFGAHWLCQSNSAVSLSRCSGKTGRCSEKQLVDKAATGWSSWILAACSHIYMWSSIPRIRYPGSSKGKN